jgi:hypothetical protein
VTKGIKKQETNKFEKLIEIYLNNRIKNEINNHNNLHLDEDALSTFVEGNLKERESILIIKHLVDCHSCRRATIQIFRLAEAFKETANNSVAVSSTSNSFLEFWKDFTEKIVSPLDHAAVAYEAEKEEEFEENLTKH